MSNNQRYYVVNAYVEKFHIVVFIRHIWDDVENKLIEADEQMLGLPENFLKADSVKKISMVEPKTQIVNVSQHLEYVISTVNQLNEENFAYLKLLDIW